jgi:alkylation response protein AidB-like acyl-CoA dehydrogenase
MDFSLSEEQVEVCRTIKAGAKKKLNENVSGDDEKERFPREKWDFCAELGIHGLPVPGEYGGLGYDMLTSALAIMSLGASCIDEGLIFSICAHLCTGTVPILEFGTNEQKKQYLTKLSTGAAIAGNAMTESQAGSDSLSIKTRVEKTGDAFVINGSKMFVTNAPVCDLLVVYAKHPGGIPGCDISAFIVERTNPGMIMGQVFRKMGLRTSPMSEVVFQDCRVPAGALLGRERMGLQVFNRSMLWERILMAAYQVGAMELQYTTACDYAANRMQFGKKLCEFQSISDELVEAKCRIETSKLLMYNACWKFDNGLISMADASLLKLLASEAKVRNSRATMQLFGAYGYMKETDIERQMRDSLAATIYSGTSEIQKRVIAENLELSK